MTDDSLATIRIMREHIQELQQRITQLELAAALSQPLVDAEVAKMKKMVDDYDASTKPNNKGGRPSNGFDDEFVLGLVDRSLAYLKANGMVNRVYRDSDATRFIAKQESRAKDKNWVETEKTEVWKSAHEKSKKTWINLISEMRTRQKTPCD